MDEPDAPGCKRAVTSCDDPPQHPLPLCRLPRLPVQHLEEYYRLHLMQSPAVDDGVHMQVDKGMIGPSLLQIHSELTTNAASPSVC
jgi:hypothetical protein